MQSTKEEQKKRLNKLKNVQSFYYTRLDYTNKCNEGDTVDTRNNKCSSLLVLKVGCISDDEDLRSDTIDDEEQSS